MSPPSALRPPLSAVAPLRQFIIGTAGHIDHGKTALVKALTGVDTDRLPEEKARGITIDIGFAHLSENITIIDVPGHERLIKNMVAGVSTIDLVLFVVAADDGVMPQSREHLDIINLLQIRHGLVVITKTDLADLEWLLLVEEDLRNLLRDTPFAGSEIYHTSTVSGEGISQLREALLQKLVDIPPRQDMEVFRQPVDRAFSVKGFGTVITGTVLSGMLKTGDEVEIQPGGVRTRVRGLQSHDREVAEVRAGYRAAVNLAGIDLENVQRGMVLTAPELFAPVSLINARLSLLASAPLPLKNNQRIRFHIHTGEAFARVLIPDAPQLAPGESGYVQLRLEQPVHAAFQDRFIVRQYSPQRTLGGGVVLQTEPFRYRKKYQALFRKTLAQLESDTPAGRISGAFDLIAAEPPKLWQLKTRTNLPLQELQRTVKALIQEEQLFSAGISGKTYYFSRAQLQACLERIVAALEKYHREFPGRAGLSEAEAISRLEKVFHPEALRKALEYGLRTKILARDHQQYRHASFTPQLSAKDSEKYQATAALYREAKFAPPTVKEILAQLSLTPKEFKELSRLLREAGQLVYIDETLMLHSSTLPELQALLQDFFRDKREITVAEFKELTGTTRKHAIPLLTYLDTNGYTERDGDVRRPGPKIMVNTS